MIAVHHNTACTHSDTSELLFEFFLLLADAFIGFGGIATRDAVKAGALWVGVGVGDTLSRTLTLTLTLTLILAPEPIASPNLRLFRSGLVRHGHRGHDGGAREGVSAYSVRQAQWRRQETSFTGAWRSGETGGGENLLLNALQSTT